MSFLAAIILLVILEHVMQYCTKLYQYLLTGLFHNSSPQGEIVHCILGVQVQRKEQLS